MLTVFSPYAPPENRRARRRDIVSRHKLSVAGLAAWPWVFGAALLCGCSKPVEGRKPVFPARGQLTVDGQPAAGALVTLHPDGPFDLQAAYPCGQVKRDGRFELTTYEAADGAPAGEYTVTVDWRWAVDQGNGPEPGPNQAPPRYASPATSDLRVRIAEGPNDLPPLQLRR